MRKGLWAVCLAAGVLSGCVSQSKYQSLETRTAAERTALEKEISNLRSQRQELERLRSSLERSLTGLRDEMTQREAELSTVTQQVDAQRRELAALVDRLAETEKRSAETEKRAAEMGSQKDTEINRLRGTYDDLVKDLKGEIAKGEIKVKQFRDKLSVQLVEKILFDSGKAEVKPEGHDVLNRVANILKTLSDKQIRIEGYTDSMPIGSALRRQFPTNWELSTQRATTVLRFLEKGGVDGKYLSAVGYGPHRPVASNETLEGRAENRRIEIVLMPLETGELVSELR